MTRNTKLPMAFGFLGCIESFILNYLNTNDLPVVISVYNYSNKYKCLGIWNYHTIWNDQKKQITNDSGYLVYKIYKKL